MGLGLVAYPYKIDGFNILTKPFEKNVLTKNLDFYNEMRDNLLIDPRLGLGPPTLYWIKALNDELNKLMIEDNVLADENHELNPLSLYAKSKVNVEKYISTVKVYININ